MNYRDGLEAEHNRLCLELHDIFRQNQQTVSFVVAAVAVVVAGALQTQFKPRYLLYVVAALVTIGGYRLLFDSLAQVWKIATYMRVFLEPELPGINWETRLRRRHEIATSPKGRDSRDRLNTHEPKMIPSMSMLHFTNVGLALAIFADPDLWQSEIVFFSMPVGVPNVRLCVVLVPLLIVAWFRCEERRYLRGEDVENEAYRSWIAVRTDIQGKAEQQQNAAPHSIPPAQGR